MRILLAAPLAAVLVLGVSAPVAAAGNNGQSGDGGYAKHAPRPGVTDQDFYFVMGDRFANGDPANDTGGLTGDRLVTGFDPAGKGFYNGGDLDGLRSKLDYIQGLGTDAIWLTPIFKNKPVQLEDGPSAGYHGYWITDFTQVDPHLGTNQDLAELVDAAHDRGMKVFFDIITNHTADVVGYAEGDRRPYVSKDAVPYQDAAGQPFDDRDYAGTSSFPVLDPATSFPYEPVLDPAEENLKSPAWLNDLTMYHNRGDTTFVGENSQYGDFFGLDDLFTERPEVVDGMVDIYEAWVEDFDIDGFRIDTMKHVNDEFWQVFGPSMQAIATADGNPDFFMFGEVALDGSDAAAKSFTSHYTTHDRMQAILDFPFQDAARGFASRGLDNQRLAQFFANDDWYTDRDSNVYSLPTFLGNHDMGRIGRFLKVDNAGADDAELLARDRLAHELMYFSRGNPVVYYGDEQGFTGNGGDQLARQSMFASQVPEYLGDDLIGTDRTHAQDNFVTDAPIYQAIKTLAAITDDRPALRDGAQQMRYASSGPGVVAFSRIDRKHQKEYVVALNNSESTASAQVPTFIRKGTFRKVYGAGPAQLATGSHGTLPVTLGGLSTSVYVSKGRIPRSSHAPKISLAAPVPAIESNGRMHVTADVKGSSFYEVTFQRKVGHGSWKGIGVDDSAPYQVYDDVSSLATGRDISYRAAVLDNAGHKRGSATRGATVPAPRIAIEAPLEGRNVRGVVEVRAVADPERATHVVRFERSVAGGAWTPIGTDSTSPVYTVFDDLTPLALAAGTAVQYRAILAEPDGTTVTSAVRSVRFAGPPATMARLHYFRPAGDYTDWGLHMWGDAVDPAVLAQIAWDHPWPLTRISGGWAEYDIPLVDDTKPVNFIMHLPNGDTVPTTREPGGDRSFVPLDSVDVWIKQGDPTVYTSQPPTS